MKNGHRLGCFLPLCLTAALFNSGCASTDPSTRVEFPGVTINHRPAKFLLDTGSDSSWLEGVGASRLGVKTNIAVPDLPVNGRSSEAVALSGPLPVAADGESFDAQFPIDTAPWLIRWLLADNFDGLIGWPEVRNNILVFDADQRSIRGVEKLPQETADWLKLGVGPTDVFTLEIPQLDGTTGKVLVDTGDPMGVGLAPARWQRWRAGHPHARTTTRVYAMPGLGMMKREEAWADEISLGALTLTDVPVYELPAPLVAEFGSLDATFGMYALARMDLVVDAGNQAAYVHVKPPPGPPYPGFKRPGAPADPASGKGGNLNWAVAGGVALKRENFLVLAARYKTYAKDYDGAIADCDRALELDPKDAGAFVIRGSAKSGKEDLAGAVGDLGRALALEPRNLATRLARAQFEMTRDDNAGAIADLDQVLAREPKNSEALAGRAEAREIQGDFAGAVTDFDATAKLNLDSSNYFRLYAHLLQLRMGTAPPDFAQTITGWKKGWTKSLAKFVTGSLDERALLAASAKKDEETVSGQKCEACYFIGMMRLLKGDRAGAREFFEKSVATKEKDYYEYHFAKGELARLDAASAK